MYKMFLKHRCFGDLECTIDSFKQGEQAFYYRPIGEEIHYMIGLHESLLIMIFEEPPGFEPRPIYCWTNNGDDS